MLPALPGPPGSCCECWAAQRQLRPQLQQEHLQAGSTIKLYGFKIVCSNMLLTVHAAIFCLRFFLCNHIVFGTAGIWLRITLLLCECGLPSAFCLPGHATDLYLYTSACGAQHTQLPAGASAFPCLGMLHTALTASSTALSRICCTSSKLGLKVTLPLSAAGTSSSRNVAGEDHLRRSCTQRGRSKQPMPLHMGAHLLPRLLSVQQAQAHRSTFWAAASVSWSMQAAQADSTVGTGVQPGCRPWLQAAELWPGCRQDPRFSLCINPLTVRNLPRGARGSKIVQPCSIWQRHVHLVGVAWPQLCILLQALHQGVQGVLRQLAQLPPLQHGEHSY